MPDREKEITYPVCLATSTTGVKFDPHYYANVVGHIIAIQLPLVVGLGMKNNIISCKFFPSLPLLHKQLLMVPSFDRNWL